MAWAGPFLRRVILLPILLRRRPPVAGGPAGWMDQRWSHVPTQLADECEARQVPEDGRPVARTGHEDLVVGRGGQTVCP